MLRHPPNPAPIIHAVGRVILACPNDNYPSSTSFHPLTVCVIDPPHATDAVSIMVSHVCSHHNVKIVWTCNEN